jgi:NYN domain
MNTRTAYFLDIDNLAGNGLASEAQIAEVLLSFETECQIGPSDLVFCAATAKAAFHVKSARPGYLVAVGRGKDGSDQRLLALADTDLLVRQFDRVVVGSGDAIFHPLISELKSKGLHVQIIMGKGRLSHHLYKEVAPQSHEDTNPIIRLKLAA